MDIEKAKQILLEQSFKIVEGSLCIQIGEHKQLEPVIAVEVSPTHHCTDLECGKTTNYGKPVHLIGTETAIQYMSEHAFRMAIVEDIFFSR